MVALNGFATLIPAFSMLVSPSYEYHIQFLTPIQIPFETKVYPEGNNYRMGPNNAGAYFEYSPSYVTDSYIISEPGYSNISVNATVQFGADKVTLQGNPTSGINAAKLDFQGVAVTDDLAQIYFDFTGTVRSGPQTSQLFSGNPNFNGSDFGYGCKLPSYSFHMWRCHR